MLRRMSLSELYDEHIDRLQRETAAALQHCGFDALVLHSGAAAPRSAYDDQYWPLRPTPAFAHWVPLAEPDCALVITAGGRPRLIRTVIDDFWEGHAEPESAHFLERLEVIEVGDAARIRDHLPSGRVAFIGEARDRAAGLDIAPEAIDPPALLTALHAIRTRKSEYELHCLAEANRRAAAGHRALARAFRDGERSELTLHLAYLRATRQDDADTPYKNIVAVGSHGAVLHHVHYQAEAPADAAPSLLVDAGASYLGYASDITRTTVAGGRADATLFSMLVAGVEALQSQLYEAIAPGLEYEALHDRAHELLAGVLRDTGIATASDDELVGGGVTRAFFPHGLGHSLGIQVHDVGMRPREPRADNPFLRNTSVIEVGQVFTIEPGCYFIDALLAPVREGPRAAGVNWEVVERLRRFGGVRIEDDIAVVEGGIRNLTRENWQ